MRKKKNLKMRFLWGERDLTKQNGEILGGKLCLLLVVVKLVDLVMLYHYYYVRIFLNY